MDGSPNVVRNHAIGHVHAVDIVLANLARVGTHASLALRGSDAGTRFENTRDRNQVAGE